ncbi:MAG: YcxB family protein [Oscillospiraceae bacterium]|nr:YcxB family protein [Oscillospiraceae bacterium]
MGMLKEMFGEGDENISAPEGEFLAKGKYESNADQILKGYKVFQKKYVVKSLIPRLMLAALAIASSIMMIISDPGGKMPVLCLMIALCVTIYFISQPITNSKNLRKGLDSISGTEYQAEFYTDKVKISTVNFQSDIVEIEKVEEASEQIEEAQSDVQTEADIAIYGEKEAEEIPATIIHLDQPIVDLLDKDDMFILVVNKSYVFIIPKSAFTEDEVQKIREKLSVIMGIRFKL